MTDIITLARLPLARRTFIGLSAAVVGAWLLPDGRAAQTIPEFETLDQEQAAALFVIARALIPLTDTPPRVYHAIVAALDKSALNDAVVARLIEHSLVTARSHFSQPLSQVSSEQLTAYLHTIEHQPFFQQVYATTLAIFFADPDVWQRIGYEGESFSKGGYLARGFNDLDWLPEPPLTAQGTLPF